MKSWNAAIKSISCTLILLGATCLPQPSQALSMNKAGSQFALNLEQEDTELVYAQGTYTTTLESVYVSFSEPFARHSELGMNFGQLYLSQDNNAATAGFYPQGYRIGVWLLSHFVDRPQWHINGDVFYEYAQVRQSDASGSQLNITLDSYGAGLLAGINGDFIGVDFGPRYRHVSGRQQRSGTNAIRDNFNSENDLLWRLAIKLITDNSGEVGIVGEGGNGRLLRLYFSRKY